MPILKDIAQVIRVHEQGNTSLVAVMLGRRLGQFRVHAKGIRRWPKKGFEGGLDLLARGEILVYPRAGDNLWLFKEWDEEARPALGSSLALLRAGSYLCELSEALTRETAGTLSVDKTPLDEQSTSDLHDHLAAAADVLASGAQPGPVLLHFTLRALECEGLLPELSACVRCDKKFAAGQTMWLSAEGLQCKACKADADAERLPHGQSVASAQRGVWLSLDAHRALMHVYKTGRPVQVNATAADQLARAMIVLVHGALERELRTLPAAAFMVRWIGRREKQIGNSR